MVVAWRASVAATITSTMATTAADSYTTVAPVLAAHHHYLYRPALVPLSCDFFLKINASLIIVLNKRKPGAFRWSWSGSPRELNSSESRKTWTEEKIKLFNFPVNRMTFCWQQKANIHSRTLNAYLVGPCQYVNDLCFEIVVHPFHNLLGHNIIPPNTIHTAVHNNIITLLSCYNQSHKWAKLFHCKSRYSFPGIPESTIMVAWSVTPNWWKCQSPPWYHRLSLRAIIVLQCNYLNVRLNQVSAFVRVWFVGIDCLNSFCDARDMAYKEPVFTTCS